MDDQIIFIRRRIIPVASVSYLFSENFEGANSGYDNAGWTPGGTVDPDYTGTILHGTESIRFTTSGATSSSVSPTFTAQTEIWGYFMLRYLTVQGLNRIFFLGRGSTANRIQIRRNSDGTVRYTHGSTNAANTVGTLNVSTTYHFWWYYKTGSGADGEGWIGFSTDGTRPTSGDNYTSLTNGSGTLSIDNINLGLTTNGTEDLVCDKVRINTSLIDSNPS